MEIQINKIVAFDYTLTDDDGEVIDTSQGREPLAYVHGQGGIIEGLETALEGRQVGDQLNVSVPPEKAYGHRSDDLIQHVPREQFKGVDDLEVGMQFQADTESGPMVFTVVDVGEEIVQVDGNHPLAGENLNFDVTIREVRDATEQELEHGHAHADGHDHG